MRKLTARGFGWAKGPRPNVPRSHGRIMARQGSGRIRRLARATFAVAAAALGAWTAVQAYEAAGPLVAGWFEIREVRVSGLRVVTRDEVLDRLQVPARATLLSVSPVQMEARVSTHPWIKTATVNRLPPHVLSVEIVERRPAAVLKTPSGAFLLDEEGAVLTALAEHEREELPVVIGIDHQRLLQGDAQWRRAAQNGIRLAGLLGQSLDGRPEIDLSDPEHAVAYIQGMRIRFGPAPLEEQWERYRAVEPIRRAGAGKGWPDVDLRFSDKVIVREQSDVKL